MAENFKVACVQTNASNDIEENIAAVTALIRDAAEEGARLITTPECVTMMEDGRENVLAKALAEKDHPALPAFSDIARETGAWIVVGSLAIRPEDGGQGEAERIVNRSYLIDAKGEIAARYDKIHMFDVDIEGDRSYRESATYRPGEKAVLAKTPWGPLGMTICYDLRFPYLYRSLAQAGARYLTIPAAFTRTTGTAHWHVLLRARAIETGCFVFAPAQCGEHAGDRLTFGHSLIIAPWGEILAEGDEDVGVIIAEIDPRRGDAARAMVPSLRNGRDFTPPDKA